ncbi:hypothetical protein [Serinicoccus kebangsaanensis]|uniref:hypothetical protein n=1 Tax=Serinicoccus kebangsaanensis TaxID=2602069 RepID=UPI00124E264C|nr:hypothetical protein [Serinicoccus kebangsaanensis]
MPDDEFLARELLTDEQLARIQRAFRAVEEHYPGVVGISAKGDGVRGQTGGPGVGVFGISRSGVGIHGQAKGDRPGVLGESDLAQGVWGESVAPDRCGVAGVGNAGHGVVGETRSPGHAGVTARGPEWAGRFEGKVHLLGDVRADRDIDVAGTVRVGGDVVLQGADLAERFAPGDAEVVPGTVVVLGESDGGGDRVRACDTAYDTGVVGVVSGAGSHRPALVMDAGLAAGVPVALTGKVWVLACDAGGPITRGDLLTTAPVTGRAQRAADPRRSHGAVLGKALDDLQEGTGLIRALVSLH